MPAKGDRYRQINFVGSFVMLCYVALVHSLPVCFRAGTCVSVNLTLQNVGFPPGLTINITF